MRDTRERSSPNECDDGECVDDDACDGECVDDVCDGDCQVSGEEREEGEEKIQDERDAREEVKCK